MNRPDFPGGWLVREGGATRLLTYPDWAACCVVRNVIQLRYDQIVSAQGTAQAL